jgi:hypothetical protein
MYDFRYFSIRYFPTRINTDIGKLKKKEFIPKKPKYCRKEARKDAHFVFE